MGRTTLSSVPHGITGLVRQRIERGGERLWRLEDFRDLPFAAVAQALSRLTREGVLERLSKGVYYHARQTAFGKSRPNPAAIQKLARGARPCSRPASPPPTSWASRRRPRGAARSRRARSAFPRKLDRRATR